MDIVDTLDRTFQHTNGVIKGVHPDQHTGPTPCREWTVYDLLEHMIGVVAGFGAPGEPFTLGADPAGQFEAAAASALRAWRAPAALERIVEIPAGPMPGHVLAGINLLDTATHAWDLATATDQPAELPTDVAEAALAASREIISPALREGRFAPEVPAPDGASATARLVAFLGRTP